MKKAVLTREPDNNVQTLGEIITSIDGEVISKFKTLELSWKDNKTGISCIPKGEYNVIAYKSPSKGDVYLLEDVPNRTFIEIHSGNFYTEIEGCILIGDSFKKINSDEYCDVSNSKNSLKKFIKEFNYEPFTLVIQ